MGVVESSPGVATALYIVLRRSELFNVRGHSQHMAVLDASVYMKIFFFHYCCVKCYQGNMFVLYIAMAKYGYSGVVNRRVSGIWG